MCKIKYLWGPKILNIINHKKLPPHPTSFLMTYLESSGNFLSENVYFCSDRVDIFKVMST